MKPRARRGQGGPRARAKAILREAGMALEQGKHEEGLKLLGRALDADPTFVEPALALSAQLAARGEGKRALELAEEAVRRGQSAAGPGRDWWLDEATRPYLKARVARATRLLELGDTERAAREFEEVFALGAGDPLGAGALAAECLLRLGRLEDALALYAEMAESAAVCYGRSLALLELGRAGEALVSLWVGVLLNPLIAVDLTGPAAAEGIAPEDLVGDAEEARDLAGRCNDLWTEPARGVLEALLLDAGFRAELAAWAPLVRTLARTEEEAEAEAAMSGIERFLAPERIAAAAADFLRRHTAEPERRGPGRLPVL